jgi:hypothetical protein
MPSRRTVLALACAGVLGAARDAAGQAAVASDLWQVAAGTLVVPSALADDGSAALWTPASALPRAGPSLRLGIEAIHAPSEVGLSGGIATLGIRLGGIGTLNAVYGRLGIDGLVRTETSPEGIGDIPVYAEVVSLGLGRAITPGLMAGVAVRSIAGQLDVSSRSQLGVDVGVRYTHPSHVTIGFATRFFDPTFRRAEQASSYSVAASYQTAPSPMWGTTGVVMLRYGATWTHGEGVQHLLSGGLGLGRIAELDVGAAREYEAGTAVWRSRLGLAVGAGRYRVYLGVDGGVNAFGATYRFGLTAVMP